MKAAKTSEWRAAEEAFLREHYPEKGPAWVAEKLGRPRSSCEAKAGRLKVRVARSREDTTRRVVEAYLADLAGHGKASIARIVEALGLSLGCVEDHVSLARKAGTLPPSRISAGVRKARDAAPARPDPDDEPSPREVAKIARRRAEERIKAIARHEVSQAETSRGWNVPSFATRGRRIG